MMNASNKYYVRAILKNKIVIYCSAKEKKTFLKSIGARKVWFQKKTWSIKFESQKEMLNTFTKLKESGATFSFDEHGWGPSSVFTYYREKELITGEINQISWTGSGNYVIRKI